MRNIDFIKEVLMSTAEYWIVAKRDMIQDKRGIDHIIFISIPPDIRRGLKYEQITLSDLESLQSSYVDCNIYINVDYPPFQRFISFHDIYVGYPVSGDIKKFLIESLKLKSNEIYDYKDIKSDTDINTDESPEIK